MIFLEFNEFWLKEKPVIYILYNWKDGWVISAVMTWTQEGSSAVPTLKACEECPVKKGFDREWCKLQMLIFTP